MKTKVMILRIDGKNSAIELSDTALGALLDLFRRTNISASVYSTLDLSTPIAGACEGDWFIDFDFFEN